MKRDELKRMLSQVDEQYITEILEAEEMTTEAKPISMRAGRFVGWAAAAAVCIVGGGLLLHQAGSEDLPYEPHSTAESSAEATAVQSDTIIEERIDYDLVWEETPEEQMIIDYTWEAGGETITVANPVLPFVSEAYSTREAFFHLYEDGRPANLFLALNGNGGDNTIIITVDDRGCLYPEYFHVDLSADAEREKPVIHIYETTSIYGEDNTKLCYELYFLYNGVGFSMKARGIALEEVEQIAASILNQSCASLWEMNDFSRYFALESPVLVSADFSMETGFGTHKISEITPFTDVTTFAPTDFRGTYHLREDGSAANIALHYENENGQRAQVIISNTGYMYAHGQLSGEGGTERGGVMLYGSRTEDGGSVLSCNINRIDIMDNGEASRVFNGWDCEITCYGMSDAEVIAFYDSLAKTLKTISGIGEPANENDYFSRDVSEITAHYRELEWDAMQEVHFVDPVLEIPQMQNTSAFTVSGNDMAQFAILEYADENGGFARLYLNAHGNMGSDFPILGKTDDRWLNGVMVYGFSDAEDPDRKELYFITQEGMGCGIVCHRLPEKQVLDIALTIMDSGISLQVMLEKQETAFFKDTGDITGLEGFTFPSEDTILTNFTVPASLYAEPFTYQHAAVYQNSSGQYTAAAIDYWNEEINTFSLLMAEEGTLLDKIELAKLTPVIRSGAAIYSTRNAASPERLSVALTANGTDYLLQTNGMEEAKVIAIACFLSDPGYTPEIFMTENMEYETP